MRILHLAWEFPPVLYGGLGRHVAALAAAECEAGHDVSVLTQHGDGTSDDERIAGVRVVRARELGAPEERTLDNLLPWVASMQEAMNGRARALVTSWVPDVVHAHDWMVGQAARAAADAAGASLVATFHATEAGRHAGWIVGEVSHAVHDAEVALAHVADSLLVCSAAMRDEVAQALAASGPISVVPNGVDLAEWTAEPDEVSAVRSRLGIPDSPLIVFCGRVVWEKGLQTVVEALPRLLAEYPSLRLVVAGRGPFEDELLAIARDQGVDSALQTVGFLAEADLRPLIASADCAVVPSLYEPFGLVAAEAAALGTPVVASDVGGLRDIVIDGQTGRLVPPGDAAALASALIDVLANPGEAEVMAAAARERVSVLYDWTRVAAQTVEVYARAHRGTGGPVPEADPRDRNVLSGEVVG